MMLMFTRFVNARVWAVGTDDFTYVIHSNKLRHKHPENPSKTVRIELAFRAFQQCANKFGRLQLCDNVIIMF